MLRMTQRDSILIDEIELFWIRTFQLKGTKGFFRTMGFWLG
jgi:hypothetical protein